VLGLLQLLRLSFSRSQLRSTGPVATCVNLAVAGVLLALPATSHPTFVFLGASMLIAAWRGYAGCETLAASNWFLGRNDQVGCVLFWPVDELEARLGRSSVPPRRVAGEPTSARPVEAQQDPGDHSLPAAPLALKLGGCAALVALLVYLAQ
jgi:hypothetical protein